MTEILLGPTVQGGPTTKVKDKKTGKVYFKKQILPVGKFNYKGSELDLSDANLAAMTKSFRDKAYDEVTFQLGGPQGEHNNDVTRRAGTMVEVEHVPGKGLFGYFDLTDTGKKYVTDFPNFGVSPRIVAGIERADGKKFDAAIEHVCGTNVPRMTGMSPWEKIELSQAASEDAGTDAEVLDFSTVTAEAFRPVATQSSLVTKTSEGNTNENEGSGMVQMSQEEYDFLRSLMQTVNETGGEQEQQQQTPVIPVELSNGVTQAQKDAQDALKAIGLLEEKARKDAWAAKRAVLAGKGVPPSMLDLAEPIMTRKPQAVYDLSTAEGTVKSDEQQVMLSMLEAAAGTVDLSEEAGHGITGFDSQDDGFDADKFRTEFGI